MNMDNSKKTMKMMFATLALITIITVSAFAASVILSNTLHDDVVVQDHAAILSWDQALPEDIFTNITYDCGVRLQGYESANVIVKFSIAKVGIDAGDVTVTYFDGANYIPMTLVAVGDTLVGEFGPAEGFAISSGYDVTTPLRVIFSDGGSYSTDLWVEAR